MKYLKKFNENINVSDTVIDVMIDLIEEEFFIRTYLSINETIDVVIAKCDFYRQKRPIVDRWDIITHGTKIFNLSIVYDKIQMLNDVLSDEYVFSSYVYVDEFMEYMNCSVLPDDEYFDHIIIKYKKI